MSSPDENTLTSALVKEDTNNSAADALPSTPVLVDQGSVDSNPRKAAHKPLSLATVGSPLGRRSFAGSANIDQNEQASADDHQANGGCEEPAKKKRKSLGRRVSFAATAHVRLFEKEADHDDGPSSGAARNESSYGSIAEEEAEEAGDDSEYSLLNMCRPAAQPRNNNSPLRPSTMTLSKPSILKAVPMPVLNSPVPLPSHSFAFASTNASPYCEDSYPDHEQDQEDMELTVSVGAILANALDAFPDPKNSGGRVFGLDEDVTMDLTSCIGGILSQMNDLEDGRHPVDREVLGPEKDSPAIPGDATMDLTACVGGIIANANANANININVDASPMDMTMCLGTTIRVAAASITASPSPFLLTSPAKARPANIGCNEMSIEDMREPHAFALLDAMSPAPSRLCKTFAPHKDGPYRGEDDNGDMTMTGNPFESTKTTTRHRLDSGTAADAASPNPPPKASLKDFLASAGIRFLDTLSSLSRRETVNTRSRDSDIMTAAKHVYMMCALVPESDFLYSATEQLAELAQELKKESGDLESQFNHSPAMAFYTLEECRTDGSSEGLRTSILQKMKALRSVARLMAKREWYAWRREQTLPLQAALAANLDNLRRDYAKLLDMKERLTICAEDMSSDKARLCGQLEMLYRCRDEMSQEESEEIMRLEREFGEHRGRLQKEHDELAELRRQELRLREALARMDEEKRALQERITKARAQCNEQPKHGPLVLEELRSMAKLQTAVNGWRIAKLSHSAYAGCMELEYLGAGGSVLIQLGTTADGDHGKLCVEHVKLDTANAKASLLKHAAVYDYGTMAGLPIDKAIAAIMGMLDRLADYERQFVAAASLQCSWEPMPAALSDEPHSVGVRLSFFRFEPQAKFAVDLSISALAVTVGKVAVSYGTVAAEEIAAACQTSLGSGVSAQWDEIRRIVGAAGAFLR